MTHLKIQTQKQKEQIELDGIFVALGWHPASKLFFIFLEINKKGEIVISPNCQTSMKGIYAVGDVSSRGNGMAIASATGSIAGIEANNYLNQLNAKN